MGTRHSKGVLPQQFEQFARDLGATVPICMIEGHRLDQLAEVGGLLVPDPNLGAFARQRSFLGSHAYTLTGVTHAPVLSMMAEWPSRRIVGRAGLHLPRRCLGA